MTAASDAAARARLAAMNQGAGDRADAAAAAAIRQATGVPARPNQWQAVQNAAGGWQTPSIISAQPTSADINRYRTTNIGNIAGAQSAAANRAPALPRFTGTGSSGGGGGRGGGGGGGGAAAPTMNQATLDWLTSLLGGARPAQETANQLTLPTYEGMPVTPFDPSMFNTARTAYQQGMQGDLGTAQQSTQNMLDFLNTNYSNPFNNPNAQYATAGQAPGMDQAAMARLMRSQGVNPSVNAGTVGQGVQADQAFGNLWRTLAGNEDIAQRGRIGNAQQYGTQAQQGITAAGRAAGLGIDLAQGNAQAQWQQQAAQRAYETYQAQQQLAQQQAMANWQRANEVSDANVTNTNQYRNAELSSLLGLVPQFVQNPGLSLPTLQQLGLAA